MKRIFVALILALVSCVGVSAQGIKFSDKGLESARQSAEKENKLIFVDFYTDWCAPCKGMANNVFTRNDVGEYFNKNFISVKVNAEHKGELVHVKKYDVSAYPTLIIVNAQGDLIAKQVGAMNAEGFIAFAKTAKEGYENENSLLKMTQRYAQNIGNEAFLKRYIAKKQENSESAIAEVETFLKIQKGMKEGGVDMLDFFLAYRDHLIIGGEAERILKANYDEFFSIATKEEERVLKGMSSNMLFAARNYALKTKDAALYGKFLDRWSHEKGLRGNYVDYKLEMLELESKPQEYKALAKHYLDSIMTARTLDQIKAQDLQYHQQIQKEYEGRRGILSDAVVSGSTNMEANAQCKAILKVGRGYVAKIDKKKEYKQLFRWINYAEKVLPGDVKVRDFHAQVLYKIGKVDQAIAMRREVVNSMDKKDKLYAIISSLLADWEKNNK